VNRGEAFELHHVLDWSLPSEEEEMMAAESTAVGLKKPMERFFNSVPYTHTSELNGLAIRTF
jgi:hypothetical protein